eukprot:775792-Pleurochrysis_carterae.AAC.1
MHTCRFCARIARVLAARSPSALSVSSLPSAWPTSPSPCALTGDHPQARPAPAPAIVPVPEFSTPGSGVRGMKESVSTIDSERPRTTFERGFVNH